MSERTHGQFDMPAAVDAWLDGTADDADFAAVDAWLAEDPANARRLMELSLVQQGVATAIAQAEPVDTETEPPEAQSAPLTRSAAWPFPLGRYIAIGAAAGLLLAAAVVAVYFASVSQEEPPVPPTPVPIATLIDATGTVIVNDGIGNPGGEYAAGDYAIDGGSAQLMLTNRVSVRMRGKTRLTINSAVRASITEGFATFHCPPGTEGYTVLMPGGTRVVDLGTRFSVRIDEDGGEFVRVESGEVAVTTSEMGLTAEAGAIVRVDGEQLYPLADSDWLRTVDRLRGDAALVSIDTFDGEGSAAGRFEADTALRPGDALYRLGQTDPSDAITLAAWVYLDKPIDRLTALVVTETDAPGRVHWQIQPDGTIALGTSKSAGATAYRSSAKLDRSKAKRWTHVAVVVGGADRTVRFYIDGRPAGTTAMRIDERFTVNEAVLGDSKRWRGRRLNGRMDDVVVLERAMDQTEIRQLYEAGRPPQTQKER